MLHREAGFAFKFFSGDGTEPPHVHVRGHGGTGKIWLVPTVELEGSRGYDVTECNTILRIAKEHRDDWLDAWRRFFGDR